jgi:hypothetical protein
METNFTDADQCFTNGDQYFTNGNQCLPDGSQGIKCFQPSNEKCKKLMKYELAAQFQTLTADELPDSSVLSVKFIKSVPSTDYRVPSLASLRYGIKFWSPTAKLVI